MKLTNKYNLPLPIVKAIENGGYNRGASDITATGIIEPTQLHVLKERYADQITEDASDQIFSLQGQSIHTILERAAEELEKDGYIAERRFYIDVDGMKLGAQIDIYHTPSGKLQDYKVTSVYSVRDGIKEEYAKQLNIGAYLLKHGYELIDGKQVYSSHYVRELEIVAILRDWSKNAAKREDNYPEHQVKILSVPLIPEAEVLEYIKERVAAYKDATKVGDAALPPCSAEERWARPDVWAIMKRGAKRALRLCDSKEGAEIAADAAGPGHEVVHRPGVSTRCESYCPAKNYCNQYKQMKLKQGESDNE
jgi:hypothetical protein